MEAVWYYVVNGAQVGPAALAELQAAVTAGRLAPGDLVWQEGTPDWVAARTVAALFPVAVPVPAPAPPLPATDGAYPLVAEDTSPLPIASRPAVNDRPASAAGEVLSLDDAPPRPERRAREPEPHPTDAPHAAGMPEWVAVVQVIVRRALDPDPAACAPTADEGAKLTAAGVMDATARAFAVWRRSVLFVAAVPCAFAALFGLIDVLSFSKTQRDGFSAFGLLLFYVRALALFALPVAAVLGALAYDRLSVSAKWVLGGGLVSLAVPLAVAFVPTDWMLDLRIGRSETVATAELRRADAGIMIGIAFYIALMPAVLSLLPAVARACVRMKLFLPESLVPGWGLMTSVPLCVLLTLATFVVLYHAASNVLLLVGLLLWIGAPLVYLTRFDLFTRPLTNPADRAAVARSSLIVLGLILSGVAVLIVYMFTARFGEVAVLGFSRDALVRPWSLDLHQAWIDYVGRSLFLTVFFSDLLLRIALSVWREGRTFAAAPAAADFDRTMSGLGSAVLPRGGTVGGS